MKTVIIEFKNGVEAVKSTLNIEKDCINNLNCLLQKKENLLEFRENHSEMKEDEQKYQEI